MGKTNQDAFEATIEQITEWKEKYENVFRIEVEEANKACYVRSIDRKIMSYISQLANDPVKYNEALLAQCWLAGDEEIKTKDSLFMSVMGDLAELLALKETKLTKL